MIRRPPRSTLDRSSAASDVYKRQLELLDAVKAGVADDGLDAVVEEQICEQEELGLWICLLYTSPSPRDRTRSRMPSSA